MTPPKVTVGIPTYNRAEWLKETIESVLTQTFTSFCLIVSDNASDDDTADVVRSVGDERIDYVRSDRNVGAIGNLNRLIALAETEFLVLLPDDDVLYPDYLGAVVDLLERFETVGLAHTAYDVIDARSRVIENRNPPVARSPARVERRDRALERLMVSRWGICFSSVAYRMKAIVEAGGFRAEDEPFGDGQLWMRVALDWDFGYIANPLVGFRDHSERLTASIDAQHGVTSDGRERDLLHSQIHFQRRMAFLDDAPLEPRRAQRLRGIARLQLLVDTAYVGLPWNVAAARLASLVRTYPLVVLRPALWRFVVAQLGGRRVRSGLRGVSIRRDRLEQG